MLEGLPQELLEDEPMRASRVSIAAVGRTCLALHAAAELEKSISEHEDEGKRIVVCGPTVSTRYMRDLLTSIAETDRRYSWSNLHRLPGYRPKPDIRSMDLLESQNKKGKRR